MYTIDCHQHFWNFDPIRDAWINDSMNILKQDFLPDDLQKVLDDNVVAGCVAVQAVEAISENDFLIQLKQNYSFIKGIVGWLDFTSEDISAYLEEYEDVKCIKGFRYILQDKQPRDLMLSPLFLENIQRLGNYNYTYDLLVFPDQLGFAAQMVKQFPNQKFVLDHIGKPNIKTREWEYWQSQIKLLAQSDNVFCKASGLSTEANWENWKYEDFTPYLDTMTESFGIDRIMYGSDWPVCLLAGDYGKTKGIVDQYFSKFSENEQQKIYCQNTIDFYSL